MPSSDRAPLSRIEMSRLIDRGVQFLNIASTRSAVLAALAALAALGYTPEVHAEGWKLLLAALGHDQYPFQPPADPSDSLVREHATHAIEAFLASEMRRARVALDHHFPDQAKFLFHGARSQDKVLPAAVVSLFLDRYAQLRDATVASRSAKRNQDKKAAALLEERKVINPRMDKQLREWIATAESAATEAPAVEDPKRKRALERAAYAFKAWLDDWRMTAGAGIGRRDYLIALGLASRRPKKDRKKGATADADERESP